MSACAMPCRFLICVCMCPFLSLDTHLIGRVFPATELTNNWHTLMHVIDTAAKWNSPRNYWAFFTERSIAI